MNNISFHPRCDLLCLAFLLLAPALLRAQSPKAEQTTPAVKIVHRDDVVYGQVHGAGLLAGIAWPESKAKLPAIISVHGGRWKGGAIPGPRRPACRLQHEESRSLSQRPGTPRAVAHLHGGRPAKHRVRPILINGVEDHVLVLCNLSRTITIAGLVEEAKKSPSKWMKEQGSAFSDFYWQGGYGAFSVSQSNVEQVRDYVAA